jgi:hypothetical protein
MIYTLLAYLLRIPDVTFLLLTLLKPGFHKPEAKKLKKYLEKA